MLVTINKELSSHDSHSDDELQELLNDHATYPSSFANKGMIQNDHRLYDHHLYELLVYIAETISSVA